MAKRGGREGPNKSQFIREVLEQNKKAKLADVNQAWTAAGHEGSVTATLFYQVKAKSGGGRRGRRRKDKGGDDVAAAPTGRGRGRPSGTSNYSAIEQGLDQLIQRAEAINDESLANQLRIARRHASAKLV